MSGEYSKTAPVMWEKRISLVVCRWGGGAMDGCYHVFLIGAGYSIVRASYQCVVDDFGNLVEVERH